MSEKASSNTPSSANSSTSTAQEQKSVISTGRNFDWIAFGGSEKVRYVLMNVGMWSTIGGIVTGTAAYIEGRSIFLPVYSFAILNASYGTLFFGGAVGLQSIRQQPDDVFNYAAAGGVSAFTVNSFTSGLKRGGRAGLIGIAVGSVYFYASSTFYNFARNAWLGYRRNQIHNSVYKQIFVIKPHDNPDRKVYDLSAPFKQKQQDSHRETNVREASKTPQHSSATNNSSNSKNNDSIGR